VRSEERAISLSLKLLLLLHQPRLARNPFQTRTIVQYYQSDPCISSITFDHDYYFELLIIEERDSQSITRCLTAHHGDGRCPSEMFARATSLATT
jgi:hypothetical protein